MPGINIRAVFMMGVRVRGRVTACLQPAAHERDLVLLRCLDPAGQQPHVGAGRAGAQQRRHLHGLRVVR